MAIDYKGNFMNQLYKFIEKNPEMNIGEILFSILREQRLGQHYFYASDKAIYNSIEKLNKADEENDEPMDEQAFNFWVEQVTIIKENNE